MKKTLLLGLVSVALFIGCSKKEIISAQSGSGKTGVRKLSFVLTNDIHGHLDPLVTFGTIVSHLREISEYKNNEAALIVLDSGDQFQGTLMSNYDEGKAVFKAFNEIKYDAAVPGNHDYDFGPIGWLFDKVTEGETSNNPREVIENLASLAKFPLLSANTYYKASIKPEFTDVVVKLDSQCRPMAESPKTKLDFVRADRPSFLKPYTIIEKAGVRIALIGLDNHSTASTTTIENVNDLCFRDETETYLELRKDLEGRADVFVILMHNGNSDASKEGTEIIRKINLAYPNGVQLAAAGHTHFVHNDDADGVRVIQDGAEAKFFGRVDLYYDFDQKKVVSEKTASQAGTSINPTICDSKSTFVCEQYPTVPVQANAGVKSIIDALTDAIAPMAKKVVGVATEKLNRSRVDESALGNILTDSLRKATQAEIAFMNAGGVRTDIKAGTILYQDIFEVLPFGNRVAIINALKWSTLKKLLIKSVQTCGAYGTLFESGLRIQFSRDCSKGDLDPTATLIHVETLNGAVLLDAASNAEVDSNQTFKVATLDFLAAGGSGFADFKEATTDETLGIAREVIVDQLVKDKPTLTNATDGRFQNLKIQPKL